MNVLTLRYAGVLAILAGTIAFTAGASPIRNDAVGHWLPNVAPNFVPWGQAKARYGGRFDAFACGKGAAVTGVTRDFDYAIGTCRILQKGTALYFGSGEPQQGRVLYDSVHRIALYYVGCCAGRTYVLAAGVPPPPTPVASADLSAVRTARGAALGMTMKEVVAAYGKAVPYIAVSGAPVVSYTTFSSDPVHSNEACGQYQTFAFKNQKVQLIQIYVGC
jgi:hypothetical protein